MMNASSIAFGTKELSPLLHLERSSSATLSVMGYRTPKRLILMARERERERERERKKEERKEALKKQEEEENETPFFAECALVLQIFNLSPPF